MQVLTIQHRYTGAILYTHEAEQPTLRDALEAAVASGANLTKANLAGADLTGARLDGVNLPGFQLPQEGTLTVWKKLRGGKLAQVLIPADAARTASLVGRKCRAACAQVLSILDENGLPVASGLSLHDADFEYRVGEQVMSTAYDGDVKQECLPGIHFFLTREEAAAYSP